MNWITLDIQSLTEEQYDAAYAQMSAGQRSRVDGFRFPEDRKRTVAAELLARRALSLWCGVAQEDICFARTQLGKPYVPGLKADFSLAHCEDLVVCAVDDSPVGIDVERLRPVDLKPAQKLCSEEEQRYIFGRSPIPEEFAYTEDPVVLERFFRLWTGKEACAKREGKGIGAMHRYCPLEQPGISWERVGQYIVCICRSGK